MADKFQYTYADPEDITSISGSTPYGLYDGDGAFVSESVQICKFVSRRLGHPTMQLEFNSGSIYAMYEESVSEYSQQINNFNIKNWMWDHYGNSEKSNFGTGSMASSSADSIQPIRGGMGVAITLSERYGEAANVGGSVEMYSGSISLVEGQQDYDLQLASLESGSSSERIEIQKVFNYGPAAMTKFYDPYAGSFDQQQMLDAFGMGNVSPAVSYILRPISYDIARANMVETSDKVRKSAHSFEIVNNKIKIFPIPDSADDKQKIWFEYKKKKDISATSSEYTENKVTDPSNVPYKFIRYSEINASGKQWIRKYTLALSKELLGIIRSKYASMPLPNGEVSLDGDALKAEGREEKAELLLELKEFLESVTLKEKAIAEQETADANQAVLNKAPLGIYIG